MNIQPAKDYKKPLYAIGLAATVMLTGVSGCRNDDRLKYAGDTAGPPTTQVQYGGETTVVNPPKGHTNTEFDVSPYQVMDANFYLRTTVETNPDDLARFSASKLEQITKLDDVHCDGRYQDYDFKIIRTDKFSTWVRSNDQYSDSTIYDGVFCVEYKRNSAESDMFLVYHDQSERFMIITDCCDNKVIYEFFAGVEIQTTESSEPTESTEPSNKKEFPEKYRSFCLEEFNSRIMSADGALRWSKENQVVVFADSKCVSGKDMWETFTYSYQTGRSASILVANYRSANKKKKQAATLDFYIIDFSGKNRSGDEYFFVTKRRSNEKKSGTPCYFNKFKHISNADDIYVFSYEKELTSDEAKKSNIGFDDENNPTQFVIRFKKAVKKK